MVVEFRVIDNGIGIDKAVVTQLFTPFSQADVSTTRRYGGTGLGLAITRHLVDMMQGTIEVQSEPGRGSTFTVRVPFVPAPGVAVDEHRESPVTGLHVVVVGDPQDLSADLAEYLSTSGAVVEHVANVEAAKELLARPGRRPAVWVLDTVGRTIPLRELRSATAGHSEGEDRYVVIGRGGGRWPRSTGPDLVQLDVNALTRTTVIDAIALAAGRTRLEKTPSAGAHAYRTGAVSREDEARQGRLILVAEDSETNQEVIRHQLAILGYAADVARDGREALELWESGQYALLLTDLHMPRLDGYELTRTIRLGEGGGRHMPIVALTANVMRGEAERCRAAGMDDYLSKPVPLTTLKAVIEKWLPAPDDETRNRLSASDAPASVPWPVDVGVLADYVGDDTACIDEFLEDFGRRGSGLADELRAACAAGRVHDAAEVAHKLTSAASTVGARGLAEICRQIEVDGRAGEVGRVSACLPSFEEQMAAVLHFLEARRGGSGAAGT